MEILPDGYTKEVKDIQGKVIRTVSKAYRKDKLIGKGAFGSVWLGRVKDKEGNEKQVAIKITRPSESTPRTSLIREINVLKDISQNVNLPSIMKYYWSQNIREKQPDEKFIIVTEYIDGVTLRDYFPFLNSKRKEEGKGPLSEEDRCRLMVAILKDVSEGLSALHSHGIIHRDIKSENIMIDTRTSQPKIIDFGLACYAKDNPACAIKQGDEIFDFPCCDYAGSPLFSAPEANLNDRCYFSSDVWSLGVVVFDVLFDKYIFQQDIKTRLGLYKALRDSPVLPLGTKNEFLNDITAGMLEKDVLQRITSSQLYEIISAHLEE